MPSTTIVVACAVVLVVLIVVLLITRSRSKEPEQPRFEPPRELAKRPPKETPKAEQAPLPTTARTPPMAFMPSAPPPAPLPAVTDEGDEDPTKIDPILAAAAAKQDIASARSVTAPLEPVRPVTPSAPTVPPPSDSKPARKPLPSYSDISDESVGSNAPPASRPTPEPRAPAKASEPRVPFPGRAEAKSSEPKLPSTPKESKVASAPKLPTSEPKVAAKPPKLPTSEPKLPTSEPKLPTSEPKLPTSEPKVAAGKPEEHDFSALNDATAKPKGEAASAGAVVAAKYAPPVNPATADLEKNDPRHAAARRLARLSVSEIKLYHEDEVKAGREAKDIWSRLSQDIALARQTFDARVAAEVRARYDYLLDELIRQLAEGDATKLGPGAPSLGNDQGSAPAKPAEPAIPTAPPPRADNLDLSEAPTKTEHKPIAEAPKPTAPPKPAIVAPPPRPKPSAPPMPAAAPAKDAAKPAGPSGIAAKALPANPETAQLEKDDPRHAAARRLARLSISEIKLYHEAEVKAGREAKDLWTRFTADISLATSTYEKRVDKEVRERFDYLYDEILRQLAEGDASRLGASAPTPKARVEAPAAPAPEPEKPVAAASAPAVPVAAPAAQPASAANVVAARYAPPANPATAELEKSDPRHAAARRLARLSVSEIKLYHEDEVKAGREAKDLWQRLTADIGLATQTYEKRVDKDVRERFDYLYDEILRQLAEGDVAKLGAGAPQPKVNA